MKRQLGVCTWTFGPTPLRQIAATLAAIGYDGVELHGDLQAFKPAEVLALLDDAGLKVFSLTPDNVDLAHPDSRIRSQALDYYKRLVDFAAATRKPLVSVHGHVGRIAAVADFAQEQDLLAEAVTEIAVHAAMAGVELVFEVLNRYESHLVNTVAQALDLLGRVQCQNLRVLLDAYHMNIEEADPAGAIRTAGARLGLFHVADSNRDAVGDGHTDFAALFTSLDEIAYCGSVIVECTPPGPNPFTPTKSADSVGVLEAQLRRSHQRLGVLQGAA